MAKIKNPYHMPRTCQTAILMLQLISTFERQIFDFLGYMWLPILGNFFNIIFVIFGLFGVYQMRINYLVTYIIWTLVWIAYNIFIVCFYLEAGDLDKTEDILSFGAGSFSWWLVNSPGCRPVYNSSAPDISSVLPPRPSSVEGCYVRFEKIEVTHAAIQLVLAAIGLFMCVYIMHYITKVLGPQLEKQGVKAMYSIEYSPQGNESNQNTLEHETELQLENGDARAHMTPRRVKRRSYRSSTRNNKSMGRQHNRQSGRSARSSGRSHKSINPVTRLIDADQNCADSSTSNDAYGQINPGFQSEVSRPNSIYNLSGPPTDGESGIRPHSALTSYSNFHGQRLPVGAGAVGGPGAAGAGVLRNSGNVPTVQSNVTNLTQESLMNHDKNQSLDASYDDLPPPPPPLASQDVNDSDSDNTSSVATAQMPVPSTRGSTRRNEYVNIPIPKENVINTNQKPEPQSLGGRMSPLGGRISPLGGRVSPVGGGADVTYHNYANMSSPEKMYGGMSPDKSYGEMDKSSGSVLTYEAETLRANTTLVQPGLYNDPYSSSGMTNQWNQSNQNSNIYNGSKESEYGMSGKPSLERTPGPKPPERSSSQQPVGRQQRSQLPGPGPNYPSYPSQGHPGPQANSSVPYSGQNGMAKPMGGQHGASGGQYGQLGSSSGHNPQAGQAGSSGGHMPEAPGSTKLMPRGHAARDRASLRLKQRKEMENRAHHPKEPPPHSNKSHEVNQQPNYYSYQQSQQHQQQHQHSKYANGGPPSLQTTRPLAPLPSGSQPNSLPSPTTSDDQPEDRWFMKDSMRPVGAASHGATCKCYRCQRKLTAI